MLLNEYCLPELYFFNHRNIFLRSEWNLINKIKGSNTKTAPLKRDTVIIIKDLFLCWLIIFKPILHLLYFRPLSINNLLS